MLTYFGEVVCCKSRSSCSGGMGNAGRPLRTRDTGDQVFIIVWNKINIRKNLPCPPPAQTAGCQPTLQLYRQHLNKRALNICRMAKRNILCFQAGRDIPGSLRHRERGGCWRRGLAASSVSL